MVRKRLVGLGHQGGGIEIVIGIAIVKETATDMAIGIGSGRGKGATRTVRGVTAAIATRRAAIIESNFFS